MIHTIIANIKEANTISSNRSYGDCEYREEDPRMAIWRIEAAYIVKQRKEQNDTPTTT